MSTHRYDYDQDTLASIPCRGAEDFGDLPALAMVGGEALSYRDLERLTRRLAARLVGLGVRKGDRVALLSENRPEWGLASLGIARSGAVAVPILADFPAEQVANILEHSGAIVFIVSARQRKKLEGRPLPDVIPIEELSAPVADAELEAAAAAFAAPAVAAADLAAIVYTSGTTGLSKGVMLTHRNYLADALGCESIIVLDTNDTLLSILPLAHAYEYTIGFVIPMMSGAQVRYLDRPPSASVLLPALASVKPTIVLSVPLVIEKVYRAGVKPGLEKISLYRFRPFRPLIERLAGRKLMRSFGGRIRFFGVGGAPLEPETEAFLLRARFPYAIGYGLTETAPIIAAAAVGRTQSRMAGPPLRGAELRIADPKPAADDPSLLVGEIQARGPMVGPGYYKDPVRTAETFTADGWFRTGDLGYADEKGRYFVRGRLKTMILGASGENIYPEEVEALLNASPFVAESLVYGDEEGITALVQLKPEIIEELAACVKDGIEGAERAALRFGHAAGAAVRHAVESAGQAAGAAGRTAGSAYHGAERAVAQLLERIKKETNAKLASFSRIAKVEPQLEPFEKTPTQKIKRFLYPQKKAE
ncbi:MAG: AMP-binding protein [Spirochaetaceae bacterium]|nr:AMP-binding protein [Spirochaetaceae bacterium]